MRTEKLDSVPFTVIRMTRERKICTVPLKEREIYLLGIWERILLIMTREKKICLLVISCLTKGWQEPQKTKGSNCYAFKRLFTNQNISGNFQIIHRTSIISTCNG